jgi:transcriptional/translational regulatory protein YebC/TACO1
LREADVEILEAELTYVPNTTVPVTDQATAGKILRLMDALEAIDEVATTHVNFDIPEEFIG